MDLSHIKTFVDLSTTGSFSRTAERLYITQSAASARIKALEDALGCKLFDRQHGGARLTDAGERFLSYALGINRLWLQGRQEMALRTKPPTKIGGGIHISLQKRLALQWMTAMREQKTGFRLHLEVDWSEKLVDLVAQGILDFAVVYMPRAASGLKVERLLEDRLVMVANRAMALGPDSCKDYVYIDWSYGYRETHAEALPELSMPSVVIGHPEAALDYIEQHGGAAYFPLCDVAPLLAERRLFRVAGAPVLKRPSYLVYPETPVDSGSLELALSAIRQVAAKARDCEAKV